MKRLFKTLLLTAVMVSACIIVKPSEVKADVMPTALQNSSNFYGLQGTYLGNTWSNNMSHMPVMANYSAAMGRQVAQSLAIQYDANVMAQQARQRAMVNAYQLNMNYDAYMKNISTQYMNMMNSTIYNYTDIMNKTYANNMHWVNYNYSYMLGQPQFPQKPY